MNSDQLLLEYLQEIVNDIVERVEAANLTKKQATDRLIAEIGELLAGFERTAEELIPDIVVQAYFGSIEEANQLLVESGAIKPPAPVFTSEGAIAPAYKTKEHIDAIETLVNTSLDNLQAAARTARQSATANLKEAQKRVKKDLVKGAARGTARKKIEAEVMQSFRENGLTSFIAKNNAKIPLDAYAATVVRTEMRNAGVQGALSRYMDSGNDLVQVIENSDTCPICAQHRGLVISLRGETEGFPVAGVDVELPPYHPNCRGTIMPFVVMFKSKEEMDEARARADQYRRGVDVRTKRQKEMYREEQRKRQQANREKKQFMAYQDTLGAEAPKTLGAFRSMKRQNTLKFQELQSLFRSRRAGGS